VWRRPPTPSSAEVKGREELHIYSLSLSLSLGLVVCTRVNVTLNFTLLRNVGKDSQKHGATFQKTSRFNHTAATTSYVARKHSFCANKCPKRLLYEEVKPGIIVTICCICHTGLKYLFISDNTSHTANKLYTEILNRVSRRK